MTLSKKSRGKSLYPWLAKLAYPSSVMRILLPLGIFQFPILVTVGSWLLDLNDASPYRFLGINRLQYELLDKSLDLYWYSISLIYAYHQLPFFGVLLALYLFRLVGHILFYVTKKEIVFILFPNFYEYVFWLLIFVNVAPRFKYLLGPNHLYITLGILFVAKFIQELIAHKFDKYYYPFVPDWVKAPE